MSPQERMGKGCCSMIDLLELQPWGYIAVCRGVLVATSTANLGSQVEVIQGNLPVSIHLARGM